MENVPFCQSMTYMTTAEYWVLIEERQLFELQGEKLTKKNLNLIDEIDRLRVENAGLKAALDGSKVLLGQIQDELEETKAENKELAKGLSRWYDEYKRLKGEKADPGRQGEDAKEIYAMFDNDEQRITEHAEEEGTDDK